MSNSSNGNSGKASGGIGFFGVLQLILITLKLRRSDEKTAETREAVIDEIADVQIMLSQLEIIFNCVAEVEDRIDFKINRQMGRIKEREAKRDVC